MENPKKMTLRIETALHTELKTVAALSGKSVQDIITRLVKHYVEAFKEKNNK